MILTDGIHVVSTDGLAELHAFAGRMGLGRCWFDPRSDHFHYDLTTASAGSRRQQVMEARALAAGALRVSSKDLVRRACWARSGPEPA